MSAPKYVQISDLLKKEIGCGRYSVGDRLPSCRELSSQLDASYLTVTNAIKLLEDEGVVSCVRGKGNFVRGKKDRQVHGGGSGEMRVGFLMTTAGDLYQRFFLRVVDEFAVAGARLEPVIMAIENDSYTEEKFVARIDKYAADGVGNLMVNGHRHFPYKHLNANASSFQQIVYVLHYEAEADTPGASVIIPDFKKAGRMAVDHLLDHGWEKIVFMAYEELPEELRRKYGTSKYCADSEVMDGMEEALAGRGRDGTFEIIQRDSAADPQDALITARLERMLADGSCAFVARSDFRYRQILDVAEKRGLKAGRDFGFVGMYNTSWADAWDLTTIDVREDVIAKLAVKAIIEVNQTGTAGDGKIFVLPILEATRVRTCETVSGASGGTVLDSSGGLE